MTNPEAKTITNPVLFDASAAGIASTLLLRLGWLTTAYGKVEVLQDKRNDETIVYPAVYVGGGEYLNLLPDKHLGNYSFFLFQDGSELEGNRPFARIKTDFSLILFFDYRDVYPNDWEEKTIENVKSDVLDVLRFTPASFKILNIYEQAKNVYKEFTHKEIDSQFNMKPYGVLRIDGEIKTNENC